MPSYSYISKTINGRPQTGEMEAKNEHELAKILRKEGYILISAELKQKPAKTTKFLDFFKKVSLVEKVMFARNLRVMISAGVSLPRALKILSIQSKSKKFKKTLLNIRKQVIEGKNFSDALTDFPNIFSELFCSMVKVGEESGTLEKVLDVLAQQMEKEYQLKSQIKGAMIYPAVIVAAMVGIGVLMLIMVVPKIAETFEELEIELPTTTKFVIALGLFLVNFWYLIPLIIIGLLVLMKTAVKTETGKLIIDKVFLKIIVISSIVKKTNSAYTARTLSSLISSGVPLIRSLELVSNSLTNIYYKQAILDAKEQVKKGAKLGKSLSKYEDIYSTLTIQMIEVGEETGETASILKKLADFYEEEVTRATKNLASIIEPVLMILVGAVVGFFAVSMIQPMYSMLGSI